MRGEAHSSFARTDKEGRLPPVPHVSSGSVLSVSVPDLEGQWKTIYEGVLGAKSQVLALFNTLDVFSAPTAPRMLSIFNNGAVAKSWK